LFIDESGGDFSTSTNVVLAAILLDWVPHRRAIVVAQLEAAGLW